MTWLLVMWIGGVLIFTLAALWALRRWMNQDRTKGPP